MTFTAPALAAMSLASTAVGVAGSIAQGNQAAAVAEYSAQLAERDAQLAQQEAAFEEEKLRDQADRLKGAQRAAAGGSGLSLEGSPIMVIAESAAQTELDALAIRFSGSVNEIRSKSEAALRRLEGSAARSKGYFQAGSSLLSGAFRAGKILKEG